MSTNVETRPIIPWHKKDQHEKIECLQYENDALVAELKLLRKGILNLINKNEISDLKLSQEEAALAKAHREIIEANNRTNQTLQFANSETARADALVLEHKQQLAAEKFKVSHFESIIEGKTRTIAFLRAQVKTQKSSIVAENVKPANPTKIILHSKTKKSKVETELLLRA
jgi:hypothetical protein